MADKFDAMDAYETQAEETPAVCPAVFNAFGDNEDVFATVADTAADAGTTPAEFLAEFGHGAQAKEDDLLRKK